MFDTVKCPYCKETNDMSDALCDGISEDNKFDWECQNCEKEFEVYVEFIPTYDATEIKYVQCDMCKAIVRDIYEKNKTHPFPEKLKNKKICYKCWIEEIAKES